MKRGNGFTLVELLIASSIFLAVILTIYSAFHTGIFGYRDIEKTIDVYQTTRQILERMALDLRNSFAYSDDETKFVGNENEASFLTLVDTFRQDSIVQDYAFVSYKLKENKLMRLCQKNQESLNEESRIQSEEMGSDIEKIIFNYGYIDPTDKLLKFKELWDDPEALPQAVKIKLTIKNRTKQDFERTVFLPLA